MDHRHGTRHAVAWPVVLRIGDRRDHGTILNVSLSGAYIRTAARLSAPAFIHLTLLPGTPAPWHPQEPALVVRTDSGGFAVEWHEDAVLDALLPPYASDETRAFKFAAPALPAPGRRAAVPAPHLPHRAEGSARPAAAARQTHGA